MTLILASSSPYRRELLSRLKLPFTCQSPNIDESRRRGENPKTLVTRLAFEKASEVAASSPNAVIIGADQVCVHGEHIVSKPGDYDTATAQLQAVSGLRASLMTGLCVLAPKHPPQNSCEMFDILMRPLSAQDIHRYLTLEQPWDCAGSIKAEGLGISLIERFEGHDPTAVIGLPLIQLCAMLRRVGIDPLA